jgi:hypothetical protein
MGGRAVKIIEFGERVLRLRFSPAQTVILKATRGDALDAAEQRLFRQLAGRDWQPGPPPAEVHVICGRQSGKTGYVAPTICLHAAYDPETVRDLDAGYWREILCVAPTRRQAGVAHGRLAGLIAHTPPLKRHLAGEPTQHEIELAFRVRLGVWAARGAHVRGVQSRLLLLDEACFLPAEGVGTDTELIESVRPGQAMVPGAQIVTISSPWHEAGYVYEAWRRRALLDDAVVFQAPSWVMNPKLPTAFLDRERKRDPEYFRREFGAEFVGSISPFLPSDSINACVVEGRQSLAPQRGVQYAACVDQAYKQDTFVLGIGHQASGRVVIDRLLGWAPRPKEPVRLDVVLPQLAMELAAYGVTELLGDQFGATQFRELLRRHGISYREVVFSSESKRDMYGSLRSLLTAEKIDLLDHEDSLRELRSLEARVTPSGNVKIEAPQRAGFHDDYADVLAVLSHALRPEAQRLPGVAEYYEEQFRAARIEQAAPGTPAERAAIDAVLRGREVDCAAGDLPQVRESLARAASRWADSGDLSRARAAAEAVRRLDATSGRRS